MTDRHAFGLRVAASAASAALTMTAVAQDSPPG
jgi:hypothetical protein